MACFAGFLVGREAAKIMAPRGYGTILFTGATAALRGASGFAAFASAKHGLRAVSASLARELGPLGVHVAHVVVDGGIDTPFVRKLMGDERISKMKPDALANPDDIAEYVHYPRPLSVCLSYLIPCASTS
jgi:NAD(P)-dependent dehydrogenase (short-subunit alcohol dehydrogenase family)